MINRRQAAWFTPPAPVTTASPWTRERLRSRVQRVPSRARHGRYVMMTMLALDRDLFRRDRNLRRGEWEGSCITGPPGPPNWEARLWALSVTDTSARKWPRLAAAFDMRIRFPTQRTLASGFGSVARRLGFPGRGLPLVRGNKRLIGLRNSP